MDLTTEKIKLLEKVTKDPITWSKFFIKWPNEDNFTPNYAQKKILKCKTKKCCACTSRRSGTNKALLIKAMYTMFTGNKKQVLVLAPAESQVQRIFEEFDYLMKENSHLSSEIVISRNKPFYRKLKNGSCMAGFVAKDGCRSLCGQSADLILIDNADFIDQKDWEVIEPIIRGDRYRTTPEMIAVSTPSNDPDSWFMNKIHKNQEENSTSLFIPITKNKDYSKEEVDRIKNKYTSNHLKEFEQEYLCKP